MLDLSSVRRIVVKVGSSTLTHEGGRLNFRRIDSLVRVLSDLENSGKQVVLVSSGAQAAGVAKLGLGKKPADLPGRQAVAAVGQCEIMHIYDKAFEEYGQKVAQILLTRDVIDVPSRLQNVHNTFETLFSMGALPIVNENDSVAVDELVIGENDSLSAMVACICGADLLIILSDIEGLYDKDPRRFPDARLIPVVEKITDEIRASAGGAGSDRGTGGMATKIHAAELCHESNIPMLILNGEDPALLYDVFEGKPAGTLFLP